MQSDNIAGSSDHFEDGFLEENSERIYLTQAGNAVSQGDETADQRIIHIPVVPGETVQLPFSSDNLYARLADDSSNLAIRSGDVTVILLGYADAMRTSPIVVMASDGAEVDVPFVLAATDPTIDIVTAGGLAAGDLGTGADNTGSIFTPYDPAQGIGGFQSVGGLDPTELNYVLVERRNLFLEPEDEATALIGAGQDSVPVNLNDSRSGNENVTRNANIMVVLDVSGSMNEDADSGTAGIQTRIAIARAALTNLLHTYDTLGEVRVTVVAFGTGAVVHFAWGSVADAIDSLGTLVPKDLTNYAAALGIADDAWMAGGKLTGDTDNIVYFLSDGKPTAGGGFGNHLTAAQKTDWNIFLEDPFNAIDHVYAVGIGDRIGTEADPDSDLVNVARPDANDLPPGDVLYIVDPMDLAERLVDTVEGVTLSGNVLTGVDTSGVGDSGQPGQPDTAGTGATYIYTFTHEGSALSFDVAFGRDSSTDAPVQIGGDGQNVSISGMDVSFDTEHGRMTFHFDTGAYTFTPGEVSADTDVAFHYGTRDENGNTDMPGGVDADGPAGGGDLVISIADSDPAPASARTQESAEIFVAGFPFPTDQDVALLTTPELV
ncbi:MAG: VWA domain-containing protein [Rhodospirillaceae bacterium]|nr:VWA domain-containing protein [Rhodospirillaceae bacterium]